MNRSVAAKFYTEVERFANRGNGISNDCASRRENSSSLSGERERERESESVQNSGITQDDY